MTEYHLNQYDSEAYLSCLVWLWPMYSENHVLWAESSFVKEGKTTTHLYKIFQKLN